MLIFLLMALIAVSTLMVIIKRCGDENPFSWQWVGPYCFAGIIAGALSLFLTFIPCVKNHLGTIETYYIEIASINNGEAISGNFFLGCGSINNREYYYTFRKFKNEPFKYQRMKIYSGYCCLIETNDVKPRYEWEERDYNNWIIFDLDENRRNERLYVPKGTIIKEFNVK